MIEVKRPTTLQNPDFVTGKKEATDYKFNCDICNASLSISFDQQINNAWMGRTEKVTEKEAGELRLFYDIGLSRKSHDGGLSVFDRIACPKCGATYLIYCGVIEFSNSAYSVTVNGIIRR